MPGTVPGHRRGRTGRRRRGARRKQGRETGPTQHGGGVGGTAAETPTVRDVLASGRRRSAGEPQRPGDEVRLVVGTPAANGPPNVMPAPAASIVSSSARSSVTISASIRWYPSGADTGDAQPQRQLRRRDYPITTPATPVSRPHSSTSSSSGRASRRCRLRRTSGVDDTGERAAEHLAPLAEACARAGTASSGATSAASRRTISTSADSTFGRGTNTRPARVRPLAPSPSTRPSPTPRRRRRAPAVATNRSPTSRCTITSSRSISAPRRADRTRAVWPRCTAGWRRAPSRARRRASTTSRGSSRRLPRPWRRRRPTRRRQRHQARSTSTAVTSHRFGQRQRERAEAGTDLDTGRRARPGRDGRCVGPCSGRRRSSARGPGAVPVHGSVSKSRIVRRECVTPASGSPARGGRVTGADFDVDRRRREVGDLLGTSPCSSREDVVARRSERGVVVHSTERPLATLTTVTLLAATNAVEHARAVRVTDKRRYVASWSQNVLVGARADDDGEGGCRGGRAPPSCRVRGTSRPSRPSGRTLPPRNPAWSWSASPRVDAYHGHVGDATRRWTTLGSRTPDQMVGQFANKVITLASLRFRPAITIVEIQGLLR